MKHLTTVSIGSETLRAILSDGDDRLPDEPIRKCCGGVFWDEPDGTLYIPQNLEIVNNTIENISAVDACEF